jgi:hypothetical protein
MRAVSDRPTHNGGYLHKLGDSNMRKVLRQIDRALTRDANAPPEHLTTSDVLDRLLHWGLHCTERAALEDHARSLGVTPESLRAVGAVWAPEHRAWAFPMRDDDLAPIGIRLRAEDGRKWAVRGSRAGLIYGRRESPVETLVVCEGPTDTAAAITLGLWAVGRPSCRGQEDLIRALVRRVRPREIVIVADSDGPGREGARALAKALRCPCRLFSPPFKDLRLWLRHGATPEAFHALVQNTRHLNVR